MWSIHPSHANPSFSLSLAETQSTGKYLQGDSTLFSQTWQISLQTLRKYFTSDFSSVIWRLAMSKLNSLRKLIRWPFNPQLALTSLRGSSRENPLLTLRLLKMLNRLCLSVTALSACSLNKPQLLCAVSGIHLWTQRVSCGMFYCKDSLISRSF